MRWNILTHPSSPRRWTKSTGYRYPLGRVYVLVCFDLRRTKFLGEFKNEYNYLLNGNKVQLYFTEMISRFFISRATEEREK